MHVTCVSPTRSVYCTGIGKEGYDPKEEAYEREGGKGREVLQVVGRWDNRE